MNHYRYSLFEPISPIQRQIAFTKLLQAAVDAQNRHLYCIDRGHDDMAAFYSAVNLLCLNRLAELLRVAFHDVDYRYTHRRHANQDMGYLAVLANVRDWRKKWGHVRALGRDLKKII